MKALALFAALVACSSPAPKRPPGPKLVVLLVVDQLPEWAFEAKLPALHGGFARALREGDWALGDHPTAATVTASGHSLIGTGQPPAVSGIVANAWWDQKLKKEIRAAVDLDDSVTSKWQRVPGLGDAIVAAGGKAVAVSLKARAAVLPLGQAGRSIWYDGKQARWATRGAMPHWLDRYNDDHPLATEVWEPLREVPALAAVPDEQPGELGEQGFGATFPHDPRATKKPAEAVLAMPLGDAMVLDVALAAIDGEHLGFRAKPDLLVISLSAYDFIGHGWGQESWEMWDTTLRLDGKLGEVLDALDRKLGKDGWAMVLTSDHGASPMPQGRLSHKTVQATAEKAAAKVLGDGKWIEYVRYPTIVFSPEMRKQPEAIDNVVVALRSLDGIAEVNRVSAASSNCDQRSGDERALCNTFDRERSGDLYYLPAKGWIFEDDEDRLATSHGSLYAYDREVPVIFLPFGRTPHEPATKPRDRIEMTEVARIVKNWLGIQ